MDFIMRLSIKQQECIKKRFLDVFKEGKIYLFGSRVDDNKKGGDIDLYIEIFNHNNLFMKKIKFLAKLKRDIGEQKIDVIFNKDKNRLIEQEARKWGVQL